MKTTKPKMSYEERVKVGKAFYTKLLRVFLVTALICCCGLGFLWFWLDRYESRSTTGAMNSYYALVTKQDWDSIYDIDTKYFTELNSKEKYIYYLKNLYEGVNVSSLVYAANGTTETGNLLYDVYYDKAKLTTLELTKPQGSDSYKVRTTGNKTSYSFQLVEPDIPFQINGIPINDSYPHSQLENPSCFNGLYLGEYLPQVMEYTITSFVDIPEVLPEDQTNYVATRDATDNLFYIGLKATDEQYAIFAQNIEDTAIAYCQYITKDGSFNSINQRLYPDTDFSNAIAGFDNQWFSDHDTIAFQNVIISDVMPLGEHAFIGSIAFDYVITAGDIQQTYSSVYQLFFVELNGSWKCTNLVIVQ